MDPFLSNAMCCYSGNHHHLKVDFLFYWESSTRGEIKIIVWTPNPPCTIPAGSCIAQLIPLPRLPDMQLIPSINADRAIGGFGSTVTPNICCSKLIAVQQSFLACVIDGKTFTGLIDTGADITIISKREWPPTWPLTTPAVIVTGIGDQQMPQQSAKELLVHGPEGKQAQLKSYVPSIPRTLWGRDLLSKQELTLTTNF